MEQDQRPYTRRIHQEATRIVDDGHPRLELRVHLEWVILIVKELQRRPPRVDHQCVKSAAAKRAVGPLHERRQVRGIQLIETGIAHTSSGSKSVGNYAPGARFHYRPLTLCAISWVKGAPLEAKEI